MYATHSEIKYGFSNKNFVRITVLAELVRNVIDAHPLLLQGQAMGSQGDNWRKSFMSNKSANGHWQTHAFKELS